MAASSIKIKKTCEWCGNEFYAQKVTTRFCCKKCNEKAYKTGLRKAQGLKSQKFLRFRIHRLKTKSSCQSVKYLNFWV